MSFEGTGWVGVTRSVGLGAIVGYKNYCCPCRAKRVDGREICMYYLNIVEHKIKIIGLSHLAPGIGEFIVKPFLCNCDTKIPRFTNTSLLASSTYIQTLREKSLVSHHWREQDRRVSTIVAPRVIGTSFVIVKRSRLA